MSEAFAADRQRNLPALLLLLLLLPLLLLLLFQVRARDARRGHVEDQGRPPRGVRSGDGVIDPAVGVAAPAAPASSSSSYSSSSSSYSAATAPTAREKGAAQLRESLKGVYKLQNRGKTGEARAALAAIPGGKELHMRSIDNAAKAMEDLLLERGGLGSVRRILDQFFDRPIIRTAMSDDLKSKSKPKPWVLKDADRARIEAAL